MSPTMDWDVVYVFHGNEGVLFLFALALTCKWCVKENESVIQPELDQPR